MSVIQRSKRCDYCLFELILSPEQRDSSVLDLPIPEKHVKRFVIEELCSGSHADCPMKEAAIRYFHDDRALAQWDCVEIFKLDESRRQGGEGISWDDAWNGWIRRNGRDSYAERFGQIWEWAKDRLTTIGMYEIIVSDNKTYNAALKLSQRLQKERRQRESFAKMQ
jgi:hypothetical protein